MDFELLESLYHVICENHAQILYDKYNSNLNKFNDKPHSKKLSVVFEPQDINNAYAISNEEDKIIIHRGLLKNIHKCIEKFMGLSNERINEENELKSVFLFSISMHYIISHEFAHLYCGHCDMLNKINNKVVTLNFSSYDNFGITPLEYQTLEMNADAFAMCRTVDFVLNTTYHSETVVELIHKKDKSLRMLVNSINIAFFVMRNFMPPIFNEHFQKSTHHPVFLRQYMNLQTLKKYLMFEYNTIVEEGFIETSLVEDEKKLCELFFVPLIIDHYKMNLNEILIEHEQNLRECWMDFRCKLEQYSRTEVI